MHQQSHHKQFDCQMFYNDRPVVFMETNFGGVKTISAPHMIVTLIYNLELNESEKYNLLVFSFIAGPFDTLNFLSIILKLFFVRKPK